MFFCDLEVETHSSDYGFLFSCYKFIFIFLYSQNSESLKDYVLIVVIAAVLMQLLLLHCNTEGEVWCSLDFLHVGFH